MKVLWATTLWMCHSLCVGSVGLARKRNSGYELWLVLIMLPVGLASMFRSSFLSLTFAVLMLSACKRGTSKTGKQLRTGMVSATTCKTALFYGQLNRQDRKATAHKHGLCQQRKTYKV